MARPNFKPTADQRRTVAIAAGAGMSHEEIALGMGISRVTLVKYFELELSTGAHQKRLEVVRAMHAAAKRGNVAAQKAYMQLAPKVAPPPAQPVTTPVAPKPEALGKKAQAQADAMVAHVGTDWNELLNPPATVQ